MEGSILTIDRGRSVAKLGEIVTKLGDRLARFPARNRPYERIG